VAGAASLTFVTATEWPAIVAVGWRPLAVMTVASELSLLLGYSLVDRIAVRGKSSD
jgi:hypothetical protein